MNIPQFVCTDIEKNSNPRYTAAMTRNAAICFLKTTPDPAVLLDLDGTLVRGGTAVEGAVPLVRALGARCAVVSNNSVDSADTVSAALARLGIDVPPRRVVLAGEAALDAIAGWRPGARVKMLGGDGSLAASRGLVAAAADADFVLLTRDPAVDLAAIAAAADAVRAGAKLVVANPDLWHPGPGARRVTETGAVLAALLACAGDVPYTVVGKPEPALFARALAALDARADRALVGGDNPATDGRGAQMLGIACAIVGAHPEAAWPDLPSFVADTGFARRAAYASVK
jgi:HAD superfamily hydrolase (TIGR01450 family)